MPKRERAGQHPGSRAHGNLVIRRKVGRSIRVGRGITITITGIDYGEAVDGTDDEVRVAIEAPQDVAVSRDDYPADVHLEHQVAREGGDRITDDEAFQRAQRARRAQRRTA